jgi:hypothetical protein
MKARFSVVACALALAVLCAFTPSSRAGCNPAAQGFNAGGSDAKAMELADRCMDAMGGHKAWNEARVLGWTIFGRTHTWDKWTGDYRLEADTTLIIMNVNTKVGRVWESGKEVTDVAKRDAALKDGMSVWINDSYWFVMPYKLKDTGVTLHYVGEQKTLDGRPADTIQLTFAGIGDTPDNKYLVWLDKESGLVTQWAYFQKASDEQPKFTLPWAKWAPFGAIKLSTGRGKFDVTGVRVSGTADPKAFAGP